ncbi:hypothetical protein E2C01_084059 [Portunus trituberculatus]|uniref:Uncharacterized protein n=1 Tax=Portunus trituberculatus TaxID=210409 RepID=A0A5B7J5A6_PORTR|nr:hypothetical protein [Portunus trituberculatus]
MLTVQCVGRFKTQGFNQYRNNCQLSYQDGSSDFDFHSDLDFDFYEKDYNSRNCHTSESLTVEETPDHSRDQGGGGGYYGGGRDGKPPTLCIVKGCCLCCPSPDVCLIPSVQ